MLYSQGAYAQDLTRHPEIGHVGIGLLFINKMEDLPLYNSQNSTVAFDTIKIKRIAEGKKKGSFEIRAGKLKEKFNLYGCSPGSSEEEGQSLVNSGLGPVAARLVFRVISYKNNDYEVVVSEKDYSTAIIKVRNDDPADHFESWEHYLRRLASIIPLKGHLSIFDYPGGKKLNLADGDAVPLTVNLVKGHWVQVRGDDKILGWVKWRDDNRLLIGFIEQFIE
jgi:hypothetical protein